MDNGMATRNEVLGSALLLENTASAFLGALLGIKNIDNSKVLGNKSGCLSFNQKIDMLIEIGALSNANRSKFQAFMEIRNQFMHNIKATTYEQCFSFTNGKDKFLLKTYPQADNLSKEEQLKSAARLLMNDLLVLTLNLIEKLKEKAYIEAESLVLKITQQAFIETVAEVSKVLDDYFNKEIEKGTTFNIKRLKGFGTELNGIIMGVWQRNFKKLSAESKEENP